MASVAPKYPAPALYLVHSAPCWRPLFVPPGIKKVRTGPTTRSELARLMADEGSNASPASTPGASSGALQRLLALLGIAATR